MIRAGLEDVDILDWSATLDSSASNSELGDRLREGKATFYLCLLH